MELENSRTFKNKENIIYPDVKNVQMFLEKNFKI